MPIFLHTCRHNDHHGPSRPSFRPAGFEDGEEEQLNLGEHGRAAQQHARSNGGLEPGMREEEKRGERGNER